jgi:hypothetical protein
MPKIMVFYVLRYSIASLTASGSTNNQQTGVLDCQRHVGSQHRRPTLSGDNGAQLRRSGSLSVDND